MMIQTQRIFITFYTSEVSFSRKLSQIVIRQHATGCDASQYAYTYLPCLDIVATKRLLDVCVSHSVCNLFHFTVMTAQKN